MNSIVVVLLVFGLAWWVWTKLSKGYKVAIITVLIFAVFFILIKNGQVNIPMNFHYLNALSGNSYPKASAAPGCGESEKESGGCGESKREPGGCGESEKESGGCGEGEREPGGCGEARREPGC